MEQPITLYFDIEKGTKADLASLEAWRSRLLPIHRVSFDLEPRPGACHLRRRCGQASGEVRRDRRWRCTPVWMLCQIRPPHFVTVNVVREMTKSWKTRSRERKGGADVRR